jgi:uncharacterized protein (DUF433 family)
MAKTNKYIDHWAGAGGISMPHVKGTRTRVSTIVARYQQLHDETPAQRIQYSYPHLSIEEIEAALEYWRSHQDEIAAEIAADEAAFEVLKDQMPLRRQ